MVTSYFEYKVNKLLAQFGLSLETLAEMKKKLDSVGTAKEAVISKEEIQKIAQEQVRADATQILDSMKGLKPSVEFDPTASGDEKDQK